MSSSKTNFILSQERLVEKAGFDRTYISIIQTGKSASTLTSICKLVKGLNMKASELLKLYEENG